MKKKYLFINSLQAGGAERQAIALTSFIDFEQVFLITPQIDYVIKGRFKSLSFLKETKNSLDTIISIIYSFFIFPSQISKNSTIISFLEYANFINILTKYFKPHISIINIQIIPSVQYNKKRHWFHNFLIRWLYPKAEKICCNSLLIKEDLIKSYQIPEHKIKVIYNSYDLQYIVDKSLDSLSTEEFPIFDKYTVLINAARLNENKAHWNLIRIFKELHKNDNNLKLIILGKGELKQYLANLSTSLGLRTFVYDTNQTLTENYDVYLWGFTQNPFKLIKHAKWFVFTSLVEGMPNSVVESIICGTPVISSDCLSGPREILNAEVNSQIPITTVEFAKYGILMPIFDGKMLDANKSLTSTELYWANQLNQIISDTDIRSDYSQKSLFRASDFDYLIKIKDWQNLIEKLL